MKKENIVKNRIVERSEKIFSQYDSFNLSEMNKICSEAIKKYVHADFIDTVKFEVETYTEAYSDSTYAGIFMNYRDYEKEEEKIEREKREKEQREKQENYEKSEFERLSKKFSKS